MIEWNVFVKQLGYADETAMWKDLYETKLLSIGQITKKLDVSRNVVRAGLKKAGCVMRPRGGKNNQYVVITEELKDEIRKDGVVAVAERLEISYDAMYKRLRSVGVRLKDLHADTSVVPSEPPTGDVDQTVNGPDPTKGDEGYSK